MTSRGPSRAQNDEVDLLIVGAGIVGLAHAVDAISRGLSVAVIERDERAVGASVRNFGHGCVTAQSGAALGYAMLARASWLKLAKDAGFWIADAGTVVVARAEDELAVLQEFHEVRGDQVVLLDRQQVRDRVAVSAGVLGGAWLPLDIRVDPREAVAAIAKWLAEQGVRFHWSTTAHTIEPGQISTSHGAIRGRRIVVALGHNVDRYFPEIAAEHGLQRCALHMLCLRNPLKKMIDPAVLTGLSMLRYSGFEACSSLRLVRERFAHDHADLVGAGMNLMFTQRPNGDLIVGDTHSYAVTLEPFNDAALDAKILDEISELLGTEELEVLQRWRGIYASAPDPYLVASPATGIRVVSVTSGIGMTTAFGLAPEVLDNLLN